MRLVIRRDAEKLQAAKLVGFEMPKSKVIKWQGQTGVNGILVLKVPGHKFWCQLPPDSYSYAPAEYRVYKVVKETDNQNHYIELEVEELIVFDVRS